MTSRIRPDLKWLLLERATSAGDIRRLESRLEALEVELASTRTTREALDRTIYVLESKLRPDAAGVVLRHRRNYQRRSALTAFLVQTLTAHSTGMSASDILQHVIGHFGLEFTNGEERKRYRASVLHSRLRDLEARGDIDRQPSLTTRDVLWRIKPKLPSLDSLRQEAAACGLAPPSTGSCDVPNPAGHQMAHQRGCDASG